MLAAQDVAARCKELGINALHIKIRATGGISHYPNHTFQVGINTLTIGLQVMEQKPQVRGLRVLCARLLGLE